jgi:thioredoxin-related protein
MLCHFVTVVVGGKHSYSTQKIILVPKTLSPEDLTAQFEILAVPTFLFFYMVGETVK